MLLDSKDAKSPVNVLDKKKYYLEVSPKKYRSKSWDSSDTVKEFMEKDTMAPKFKKLVREGIPDELRCIMWTRILKIDQLPSNFIISCFLMFRRP